MEEVDLRNLFLYIRHGCILYILSRRDFWFPYCHEKEKEEWDSWYEHYEEISVALNSLNRDDKHLYFCLKQQFPKFTPSLDNFCWENYPCTMIGCFETDTPFSLGTSIESFCGKSSSQLRAVLIWIYKYIFRTYLLTDVMGKNITADLLTVDIVSKKLSSLMNIITKENMFDYGNKIISERQSNKGLLTVQFPFFILILDIIYKTVPKMYFTSLQIPWILNEETVKNKVFPTFA
jgi:hypothetical protein